MLEVQLFEVWDLELSMLRTWPLVGQNFLFFFFISLVKFVPVLLLLSQCMIKLWIGLRLVTAPLVLSQQL